MILQKWAYMAARAMQINWFSGMQ